MSTLRCTTWLWAAALALAAAGCGGGGGTKGPGTTDQVTGVTLTGRVMDATTDAGVANANVTVEPTPRGRSAGRAERRTTVTNAEGLYSLANIQPGGAKMSIDLPDGSYQSIVLEIDIPSDRPTATVSARLVPRDVPAPTAIALTPANPSVVVGNALQFAAQVSPASQVKPSFSVQGDIGTINAEGIFAATKVGTGQVVASAGSVSDSTTVVVTSPVPTTGTVTGTVRDSTDLPLSEATVSGSGKSATTGGDGQYTLDGLTPGTVTLTASKAGFSTATQSAVVTAGQVTALDWRLTPTPVVTVRVDPQTVTLDPSGVQTFVVVVTGTGYPEVDWSVQEGAAGGTVTSGGTYFAPTARGTYHVVVTSRADTSKSATATVSVQSATHSITIE